MLTIPLTNQSGSSPLGRKIRVMLVDDSVVIRSFISRIIESQDNTEVVGSVQNGKLAIQTINKADPDIVVLDIEMPVMDGITALPGLLKARPGTRIVMCSTLTTRNAGITLKAMSLGAIDCIAKPTSSLAVRNETAFQDTLLRMVNEIGGAAARERDTKTIGTSASKPAAQTATSISTAPASAQNTKSNIVLKNVPMGGITNVSLVVIGSSTGGPQALFEVLKDFTNMRAPIVITQHMPPMFTSILAQHIEQQTGVPTHEGEDGMILEPGHIYVAPGGKHMTFVREAMKTTIKLSEDEPENFCRPSVDPMVRSAVEIYGARNVFGVMLTGMGHDGQKGFTQLVEGGGHVIAQDEATSVVWGMPGAIANAGICCKVLPLQDIGSWVRSNVRV